MAKKYIVGLEHYPHSPDLAPVTFCSLQNWSTRWRNEEFLGINAIQKMWQQHLRFYPEAEFHIYFQKCQHSQAKDTVSQTGYFEGDLSH